MTLYRIFFLPIQLEVPCPSPGHSWQLPLVLWWCGVISSVRLVTLFDLMGSEATLDSPLLPLFIKGGGAKTDHYLTTSRRGNTKEQREVITIYNCTVDQSKFSFIVSMYCMQRATKCFTEMLKAYQPLTHLSSTRNRAAAVFSPHRPLYTVIDCCWKGSLPFSSTSTHKSRPWYVLLCFSIHVTSK